MLDHAINMDRMMRLMLPSGAMHMHKGISRNGRILAAALAMCLAVTGCTVTREVKPGALADVRKTGVIVWEQEAEGYLSEDIDVSHVLVLNVGGSTEQASLNDAIASLRDRGWDVWQNSFPYNVVMQSSKWPGARLAVYAFNHSQEQKVSDVKGAIARREVKPGGLVSVVAYQAD